MLIHKICMAFRGLGSFKNVEILISDIAAMLLNNIQQRILIVSNLKIPCQLFKTILLAWRSATNVA